MGRTNYMIVGMGLATCVLLSLLMQHVLKVKRDGDIPPIVGELTNVFGSQFSEPAKFTVTKEESGRVGELVVFPLLSTSRKRVVRSVGEYVWRNLGAKFPIDALVIESDDGFGHRHRYAVPRPHEFGKSLHELKPGESPFGVVAVDSGRKPPRPATSQPTSQPAAPR